MFKLSKLRLYSLLTLLLLLGSAPLYAQVDLALNKAATGSTNIQAASLAVDGNGTTRWESAHQLDPSWISVDLGSAYSLGSIVLDWEAANAADYLLQGSNDNNNWATLATKTGGTFGNRTDTVAVSGSYRYVRMYGQTRSSGNSWGYSIFSFKVYAAATSSSSTGSVATGYNVISSSSVQFYANNASWVDVHYTVNAGPQQNIRMTHNADNTNVYTLSGIPAGVVVAYNFTVGPLVGGAYDTVWAQFNCCGAVASSSKSSVPSSTPATSKSSSSSSVAPAGIVQLYQDCNYGGWVANFGVGSFDVSAITSAGGRNDDASSLHIAAGYKATLYADGGFTGTAIVLRGDVSCLVASSFNDILSSMVVSVDTSSSSSSSRSSTSSSSSSRSSTSSSTSSVTLGNIVPLYNSGTALEPVIQFDRGDALVTRFSDRARDRHAKENHFQLHDHYLPFYWETRTDQIEIVDYVAKGGTTVRMNVITLGKLDDLQAENRWWYIGNNTLAEFCGNGVMNVISTTSYWKESNNNCRENFRQIKIGDKLEFEISLFLDGSTLLRGRNHYYGSTFLYIVGKGLVPWDVTDMNPFVGGKTFQRDSIEMPASAQLGGIHSLNRQTSAEPADHFMQMSYGTGYNNGQPFMLGRRLAHTEFTNGKHDESEENGIFDEMVGKAGPNYVNSSCVQCHNRNGRAPVAAIGEPLTKWVFKVGDGSGNPSPTIGRVLQPQNVNGAGSGEGGVSIASFTEVNGLRKPNFQFERGAPAQFSARIAPQLVGMGLLEAIPESAVLALADENDANGDGISGKAQKITDPVTGEVRLGRFGYKAATTSVRHQVAAALNTDMGVTTSVLPKPDCGTSQSNCGNTGTELSDAHLANLVKYIALLGVRSQRDYNDAQVIQGKSLFTSTGCAACHTETFTTSAFAPLSEVRSQVIHPYTDLLLHDMGTGLADNLGEGSATGAEWRTPPLWGIGLSPCVTGGVTGPDNTDGIPYGVDGHKVCTPSANYLHDGRARNLDEAIRWHGGEGLKAEQKYEALSSADKSALVKFLNSL